ncbi:innexin inx3-like [Daktulosphaira vitifoliae]|uniref:innexin inx3-like n=1 Tax=Daktulosphaira vitifoliae TaxID=58002 RepID=UPI0021A9CE64|nr:innexin inx3-like [Daktulosphaira vitifoliae]XP_050525465.1 innexin inx3-like [Daktulosphaira vitifoliae]XP_050525466.1 innexin inx3-like [Daktulosphaira vitifoliae]
MVLTTSLSILSKSFKVRNDKPKIDHHIFQCHYKLTTNILFTFCILVTANSLIGDPIECLSNFSKKPEIQKVVTKYCWLLNTFTINNHTKSQPMRGLGHVNGDVRQHSYYQWVPVMLFFQAITFYIPHWIWKILEDGKIRMITEGIRGRHIDGFDNRKIKLNRLIQYCLQTLHTHNVYACGYFLCELLNTVNILGNIYITNKFLGSTFLLYGYEVTMFYINHKTKSFGYSNPMEVVFPKITKCIFYKYGPSGSIQDIDVMCILSQNNINEKIYFFLWFWFIIVGILSIYAVLYRLVYITQSFIWKNKIVKIATTSNNKDSQKMFIKNLQVGDVLFLNLIEKNIHFMNFKVLVEELWQQIKLTHSRKKSDL